MGLTDQYYYFNTINTNSATYVPQITYGGQVTIGTALPPAKGPAGPMPPLTPPEPVSILERAPEGCMHAYPEVARLRQRIEDVTRLVAA